MAFISSAKHSRGNEEVNTTSTNVFTASDNIGIDEDDIEDMDIKWNMALLSMRADRFWKKTGKKKSIQGTDVTGFDKSKVECFNCHKMGHFARECRAPKSQDRGRRDNYRQGSKVKEQAPKALMAIDGLGWDWSYMANDDENHALVADKEAHSEFALMAKTSAESKEGLGYSVVHPPPAQVYSPPKKDMSLTGLLKFKDDTIIDYSRPSPAIESNLDDAQNRNPSVTEIEASPSTISPKPFIMFVKENDSPTKSKTDKVEIAKKPPVKYVEQYRKPTKKPNVIGSSQNNIDDKGYWDSGCSRHMTGNISYLSDYEPFDGGYVSFGQGGCKITGKGTIKIECIVLGRDFKLLDDANVLLRTPRQHNIYSINLNNIVPHKDLTYLVAKASADEGMLWHRRLGHLNFKIMNRLVRHNLVKGLPSKCFENDHTCSACLKGKQHKASYPPAIGFHKPFRFHVIILNTLDHLGKFKAKRDEGYFIGYSMSSKAFRVFNKRTQRVEENLHVEFFENKAIEKGAGPNWLFDIDSLTKSMNYVPVVAGTNSTNLSESSSSKPQDDCSTDVPESSGNSNLTATSKNPSADQMETLTVETPIPTVNSPVLTAYFTDSQKPSSDTRLISKRVANQVETSSLDNILTLTNRFKDILGVTTNSDESNGVEADDPEFLARVYKVEQAMYGLHQAPRAWYGTLSKYLLTSSFQRGIIDQTLFIKRKRGNFILVQVYMDDIIFGSSNPQLCREFKALMHEKFQMSAMGELNFFLGLQVLQKEDGIFSLKTSRHQVTPKECHLHAVMRIFIYLKGHPKLGLWYPKESPFDLVAYSDSNYGGATQDRKSTTKGCQFLSRRLISWQCKKQTIMATSTTKAEYVVAASCCGQDMRIQNQLLDYGEVPVLSYKYWNG
nr:putative ribonuclease H-like domain-containing protein [Tanacetum cinerariifolium]